MRPARAGRPSNMVSHARRQVRAIAGVLAVGMPLLLVSCGGATSSTADQSAPPLSTAGTPNPSVADVEQSPPAKPKNRFPLLVESRLVVRGGPGTNFDEVGSVAAGRSVTVACSTDGEAIESPDGVLVSRWDRISRPVEGYVAGAYVDTGGADPDVPLCRFAPDNPTQPDATGVFAQVANGVIRIETTTCDGEGSGSGFLVAPDLVATVAHVVDGAVSISLRSADSITSGQVVGISPTDEVALVRSSEALTGHVFDFSEDLPEVGQDVLAIGYPYGGEISLTKGTISGLGRTFDAGAFVLEDMIQTDAAANPGNSGGPLLSDDGEVLGLIELRPEPDSQGITYAVASSTARPLLDEWSASPTAVATDRDCENPSASSEVYVEASDLSEHPEGPAVLDTMRQWANAINAGEYASAWSMYSARFRSAQSYEEFTEGNSTSLILELRIWSVDDNQGDGRLVANIGFISVQDPEYGYDGQRCSFWDLNYTMVFEGGWRIDRAESFSGGGPEAC